MARDIKKFAEAFAVKDEIEGFLANLEKLKADGSITEEQYTRTSDEYYERLGEAASEIVRIKNELKKQLETNQRDIESCRQELTNLEVKHKVGELPLAKYQASEKKLRIRLEQLEQYSEDLTQLIHTSSAADIGAPVKKPRAVAASEPPAPARAAAPAREGKLPKAKRLELPSFAVATPSVGGLLTPRTKLVGMVGGVLLLISIFLPWIAASELLGKELGSASGMGVSGIIGAVGIVCGLAAIAAAALLVVPKARGLVQIATGGVALVVLLAVMFTNVMPLQDEYYRTLVDIREGLYLYIIAAVVLIAAGLLERRQQ